ncbi:MAG: 30S ribosomal protein S9 [Deltaproteobacteria bacterium]|nr:30S ribosomal protein S9 [Deltaproteobacteria bacterium]
MTNDINITVGRRKTSVARVKLVPGKGEIFINDKVAGEYLGREPLSIMVKRPLDLTENMARFDVHANVNGGGISGQAGAVMLAIARALVEIDIKYKGVLKKEGLLTRDPRMKERKKYGQRGARAKFQFSKR